MPAPVPTPPVSPAPGPIIVLDAGHSPWQQGAAADGTEQGARTGAETQEQALVWDVAMRVARFIPDKYLRLTRPTYWTNPTFAQRVAVAQGAALFVSVHANAGRDDDVPEREPRGIETFYADGSLRGGILAGAVHAAVVKATGAPDRGLHPDTATAVGSVYVLRKTPCPACLVEVGYLTSQWDHAALGLDTYRQQLALGIYNGIQDAIGALKIQ